MARLSLHWRACLWCRDVLLAAGKGPTSSLGLRVPLLVFLGFVDCINPSHKAAVPDVGNEVLVMGRDAFITEPQELEQPSLSCVHHAPPDLALSLLL